MEAITVASRCHLPEDKVMDQLAGLFDINTRLMLLATALGFMVLEYFLGRLTHRDTHDPFESAASLGVAAGQSIVRAVEATLLAIPFAFVYQHRLFDFPQITPMALAALFVAISTGATPGPMPRAR
jgi:hypothetical protein